MGILGDALLPRVIHATVFMCQIQISPASGFCNCQGLSGEAAEVVSEAGYAKDGTASYSRDCRMSRIPIIVRY